MGCVTLCRSHDLSLIFLIVRWHREAIPSRARETRMQKNMLSP